MAVITSDFFGFPLEVGDTVGIVYVNNLATATVVEIVDQKMIVVSLNEANYLVWEQGHSRDEFIINVPSHECFKRICSPDDFKLLKFAMGAEQ
jgi:hypothetical protein